MRSPDFTRAVQLRPDYADAYTNAGNTQKGLGQYAAASQSLDRALAIKPADLTARWSKAVLLLAQGELVQGWPLYEARLQLEPACHLQRTFAAPRWTGGESLRGKTLFVHAEQGLGYTLQFCRYIAPLEALGANVVFEVQPPREPADLCARHARQAYEPRRGNCRRLICRYHS